MSDSQTKQQQLNKKQTIDPKKMPTESLLQYNNPIETELSVIRKKQSMPIPTIESKPFIDDLLNTLILPRDWEQDNRRFMQTVSSMPPSRDDITNLQKLLDERLVSRQARESGLCPIREELYGQCFDEIIRQITIDCMERGLISAKVRDDLKKTIRSYRTLYEGSIPFGEQKQMNAEEGLSKLERRVNELQDNRKQLENKKAELLNKKEALEKQIKENNIANEQRRKADIEYLKYQGSHLESLMKQMNPNKQ